MAVPQLYREITLDMRQANQYRTRCLLTSMIANAHYCDHIRALTVSGWSLGVHCNQTSLPLDMLRQIYIIVSLAHHLEAFR